MRRAWPISTWGVSTKEGAVGHRVVVSNYPEKSELGDFLRFFHHQRPIGITMFSNDSACVRFSCSKDASCALERNGEIIKRRPIKIRLFDEAYTSHFKKEKPNLESLADRSRSDLERQEKNHRKLLTPSKRNRSRSRSRERDKGASPRRDRSRSRSHDRDRHRSSRVSPPRRSRNSDKSSPTDTRRASSSREPLQSAGMTPKIEIGGPAEINQRPMPLNQFHKENSAIHFEDAIDKFNDRNRNGFLQPAKLMAPTLVPAIMPTPSSTAVSLPTPAIISSPMQAPNSQEFAGKLPSVIQLILQIILAQDTIRNLSIAQITSCIEYFTSELAIVSGLTPVFNHAPMTNSSSPPNVTQISQSAPQNDISTSNSSQTTASPSTRNKSPSPTRPTRKSSTSRSSNSSNHSRSSSNAKSSANDDPSKSFNQLKDKSKLKEALDYLNA